MFWVNIALQDLRLCRLRVLFYTPSEVLSERASPRRHAPRFHFISEICGTGAGGACSEEETATMDSSLLTTLKTKKECEIALYRHDPERFTKALRPRLPSCHPNDNQYQPHQNPSFVLSGSEAILVSSLSSSARPVVLANSGSCFISSFSSAFVKGLSAHEEKRSCDCSQSDLFSKRTGSSHDSFSHLEKSDHSADMGRAKSPFPPDRTSLPA